MVERSRTSNYSETVLRKWLEQNKFIKNHLLLVPYPVAKVLQYGEPFKVLLL